MKKQKIQIFSGNIELVIVNIALLIIGYEITKFFYGGFL